CLGIGNGCGAAAASRAGGAICVVVNYAGMSLAHRNYSRSVLDTCRSSIHLQRRNSKETSMAAYKKTEAAIARLSAEEYRVTQQNGTERAGTGALLYNKEPGIYVD